jgi:hypothetical protein
VVGPVEPVQDGPVPELPDENHWILKPGDVEVWYQNVLAFLAEHLRGEAWQQPELLS